MTAEQLSLFDQPDEGAAAAARDEGIARAALGADVEFVVQARLAVRWCARALVDFTTDDVLSLLNRQGVMLARPLVALGPVMLASARAGEIVKTGELRATRFRHRHRDLTVWRRAS